VDDKDATDILSAFSFQSMVRVRVRVGGWG
jgi:hypothetical protein